MRKRHRPLPFICCHKPVSDIHLYAFTMAEPLKNQYSDAVPRKIAWCIHAVHPAFAVQPFLRDALRGYDALSLMQRGQHMADALAKHLPPDYPTAIGILLDTLDTPLSNTHSFGMSAFFYLPHTLFVARYGLDHFDVSMHAQYVLTQHFTAEFSIRPFIVRHPQATLAVLHHWTQDESEHVRRLVSEGTRPRLPWASQLPAFKRDPRPALALLEQLKDDDSLYVRRSVANHLNDIGKDNPAILEKTARRWLKQASPERRWLVQHALRSAIKRGESGALSVLGLDKRSSVIVCDVHLGPKRAVIGQQLHLQLALHNPGTKPEKVLADFRIHYVKANGSTRPKTFKLKTLTLAAGATATLRKTVSLADMSTRKHYPGQHGVELLLNGHPSPLGTFVLRA
jgi:3-methyladenine DNA glycosylase AlkC